MISSNYGQFGLYFFNGFFFCNIFKVNHFLYHFIALSHSVSSFSLTRSLLVAYAYVSIKSIDSLLLSSFELKAILLISLVKTLCLSLLNLCGVFDINLLFFMNYLWYFLRLSTSISFFLDGVNYFQVELLLKIFIVSNLGFLSMAHFFVSFAFLSSLLLCIK